MGMDLYRGTQTPGAKGVRGARSYTPSLPVAIIWSAEPSDSWSSREAKAKVLPTSTVEFARLNTGKILELSDYTYITYAEILKLLKYKKRGGIDQDEALKILKYLHNRITGMARGGEFKYTVTDSEGEPLDPNSVPFSFTSPMTLISEFKDEFEWDGSLDTAEHLTADTFIFADAPAVQRAALKLGYEVLMYPDVFAGGEFVAEKLLGIEVYDLKGVEEDRDLDGEYIPTHETFRPLVEGAVVPVQAVLTSELLREVDMSELKRAG